jgi:hypothetical protein
MFGILTLAIVLLGEPAVSEWRVVKDDPGGALTAVDVASLAGPPEARTFNAVATNADLMEAGQYLVARFKVDCVQQQTTLISVEMKAPDGTTLTTLSAAQVGAKPAPTRNGAPSVIALTCEGAPMTNERFESDVEFVAWATGQLRGAQP